MQVVIINWTSQHACLGQSDFLVWYYFFLVNNFQVIPSVLQTPKLSE